MFQKSALRFFLIGLIPLLVWSCFDDDAAQPIDSLPSTFQIVENSDEHTEFLQLIRQFDLDTVLDSGTYTVLAPIDFAFADVDLSQFSEDELRNLVKNHIITGNAESANLSNTYLQSLAQTTYNEDEVYNLSLLVTQAADITFNGVSQLLQPDLLANNGVVHVIDQLIPLPSISDFILYDQSLTNLQLQIAGVEGEDFAFLSIAESENAPFTFFAPTNEAFITVISDLAPIEVENFEDLSNQDRIDSFNFHIVENEALRLFNFEAGDLSTRAGNLQILLNDLRIRDVNGRTIFFEETNIQATNGVMHRVEQVILSDLDLPEIIPNFLEVAQEEGFVIFVEAVNLIQGFNNTLFAVPELTVFAPTDAAFQQAFANVGAEDLEGFLVAIGGVEDLQNILNFHMVNSLVELENFSGEQTLVTRFNNQELTLSGSGANIQLQAETGGSSTVITQDLINENGFLHGVNTLLIPQP